MNDYEKESLKVDIKNREEYYVFQPNYYQLKTLSEMMNDRKISFKDIIRFIVRNKIDLNSYIKLGNDHKIFVPLIYACSLTPHLEKVFIYLLKNKADPTKIPDADDDATDDLLFVCHEKYFKTLIKNGCTVDPKRKSRQIRKKIQYGNYKRLMLLLKHNLINEKDIAVSVDEKIYIDCVKVLIDRIYLICGTTNMKADVDTMISKYVTVFLFIQKYSSNVHRNTELTEILKNNYLFELLELPFIIKTDVTAPKYHEDMDDKIVAMLRQLYNDYRYTRTCQILNLKADTRA